MDFGALPPEINSARMYAGPGPESILAAAAAWDTLAAELQSGASSYGSLISELASEWQGPSSALMEDAAAPYVSWLTAAAGQAEQTAAQARAAASAYQVALTSMVPLPEIAANRTQLAALTATNVFGQNTPAIAANWAHYFEMWAQDAAAMYGYAGSSAAASRVTPFTAPPSTTNPSGAAGQSAAVAQAAGSSTGTGVQSALSQLISTISTTLQSLASPSSAGSSTTALPTSGLSGILGDLLGGSSGTNFLGTTGQSLFTSYATLPGFFGMFMAQGALAPLMGIGIQQALSPAAAGAGAAAGAEGALGSAYAAGAAAAEGGLRSALAGGLGGSGGLGGLAGLGQAASVGGLSVPATWGWAATAPAALLGSAPLGMLAPAAAGADVGAGLGFPFMFPGLGGLGRGAAAAGAGAIAGAAAAKYLPRLSVVTRSPVAGYRAVESVVASTPKYPVPAGFPTNGDAPPGYQPAVIYLPTNGHAKAEV